MRGRALLRGWGLLCVVGVLLPFGCFGETVSPKILIVLVSGVLLTILPSISTISSRPPPPRAFPPQYRPSPPSFPLLCACPPFPHRYFILHHKMVLSLVGPMDEEKELEMVASDWNLDMANAPNPTQMHKGELSTALHRLIDLWTEKIDEDE